jgi:hypothetical protein
MEMHPCCFAKFKWVNEMTKIAYIYIFYSYRINLFRFNFQTEGFDQLLHNLIKASKVTNHTASFACIPCIKIMKWTHNGETVSVFWSFISNYLIYNLNFFNIFGIHSQQWSCRANAVKVCIDITVDIPTDSTSDENRFNRETRSSITRTRVRLFTRMCAIRGFLRFSSVLWDRC